MNSVGDRPDPCGTPTCIILGVEISLSTETNYFLLERKELMSFIKVTEKSNFDSLYSKPVCHAVSKSFLTSKNTAAVDMLFFEIKGHVIR
jgi:hypothetical protein